MQVDFLIVGQGLAGSLLAQELLRRGRSVHVVDDRWKSSSSQVAAGLMTPLTGRRFTLTKEYPALFAAASERLTALGVFRAFQVYRMFVDDEQRAKGLKRTECRSCQPFIERVTAAQGELDAGLTDTFGGALMNGAWVDLPKLLADVRAVEKGREPDRSRVRSRGGVDRRRGRHLAARPCGGARLLRRV